MCTHTAAWLSGGLPALERGHHARQKKIHEGWEVEYPASVLWSIPQPDALADVTGCYGECADAWPFYGECADAWQAQPSYGDLLFLLFSFLGTVTRTKLKNYNGCCSGPNRPF